ncbi:hypothetical protein [Bauldia sp.]|uniref:hypothetical protein n=1 Tax=Bauldia sp. TaxID=2575872 RepID=UPI003BA9FCB8
MLFDPAGPVFQAAVAPFLVSFVLVGVIFGLARGPYKASLPVVGAAVAILVAYWLAFSWPPFPPRAASQKLGYLFAASTLLSLLLAFRSSRPDIGRVVAYVAVIAGLVWIAQSRITQGQFVDVALVLVFAAIAVFGLARRRDETVDNGVAVLVLAFAVALIALLAPSGSILQLSLASAAAIGGYLVWTWPKRRLNFSEAGILAVGAPLIWLGGQASLYSGANDVALAIAALIPFAPSIRAAVLHSPAFAKDWLRPIATGVIAVAIGAVAVAVALFVPTN